MNLPEDFDKRAFEVFDSGEVSEPLIMAYRYLSDIVLFKGNALILSHAEMRFMANDREIQKFLVSFEDHSMYEHIKTSFLEVFKRDMLVQDLFRYEFVNDDLVVKVKEV